MGSSEQNALTALQKHITLVCLCCYFIMKTSHSERIVNSVFIHNNVFPFLKYFFLNNSGVHKIWWEIMISNDKKIHNIFTSQMNLLLVSNTLFTHE